MTHPRISLHQVAFMDAPTTNFLAHCRSIGIQQATLVTPKLAEPHTVTDASINAKAANIRVSCLNHVFAVHPDLDHDSGNAAHHLDTAIATATALGAPAIYLISGGRGTLDWEAAAARFAALIAPCVTHAQAAGIALMVENASPLNADIHLAHTLDDATRLAQMAGIGLCLDLHACWWESDIARRIARVMPMIGLVQVSDYVLGDRTTPCRAVPGDGTIPLERLLGAVLNAGYAGLFDIELVGPRIIAEGAASATTRAAAAVSDILTRLGA